MSMMDNHLRRLAYRVLVRKGLHLPTPLAFRVFRLLAGLASLRKIPSIRLLEREYLSYYTEGLASGKGVWTSIFVPTELLYAFGLSPLCLEGISALSASMGIADEFLGKHGTHFVPNTMCNYHRLSIDLGKSGILTKPLFILASSVLCDGNVKTFSHLAEETDSPFFFLDIPQEDDSDGVLYLVSQLKELIAFMERVTGQSLNMTRLETAVEKSVTSRQLLDVIYEKRCRLKRNLFYGHQMINFMLPMNAMAGSGRLVRVCRALIRDLDNDTVYNHTFPREISADTIRIVWSHIAPSFQYNEIWPYIDDGKKAKIVMEDCTRIQISEDPANDPLEVIARRLINISGNGSLEKRLNLLEIICRDAKADGIVHFSHWGCHHAGGAVPMMQKHFTERGIPFLNINGDGVDARNCGQEQHKTRYSAFLESIISMRH